jgi:hypothetical protein
MVKYLAIIYKSLVAAAVMCVKHECVCVCVCVDECVCVSVCVLRCGESVRVVSSVQVFSSLMACRYQQAQRQFLSDIMLRYVFPMVKE